MSATAIVRSNGEPLSVPQITTDFGSFAGSGPSFATAANSSPWQTMLPNGRKRTGPDPAFTPGGDNDRLSNRGVFRVAASSKPRQEIGSSGLICVKYPPVFSAAPFMNGSE